MIVGVVPCAGASKRMGQPKALLQAHGETFVASAVNALRAGGCDVVFVVVPADVALKDAAAATGATVLLNPDPGEGPITSLRLVLAAGGGSAEGLVDLPVDHPLVRSATVASVIAAARATGAPLVVPTLQGDRGHPAYFSSVLFSELADPDLVGGARTVVHRHIEAATLLAVDDPGIRSDIDTPAAYAAAFGHAAPASDQVHA